MNKNNTEKVTLEEILIRLQSQGSVEILPLDRTIIPLGIKREEGKFITDDGELFTDPRIAVEYIVELVGGLSFIDNLA